MSVVNGVPPSSYDAERAVLGSVLKSEQALDTVSGILKTESAFYDPKHRAIYGCILDLHMRCSPVDITTVSEQLSRSGDLEKIGGRVYLVDLVEWVSSTANVGAHAEIVLEKWRLRQIMQLGQTLSGSAESQRSDSGELVGDVEKFLLDLEVPGRQDVQSLADITERHYNQIFGRNEDAERDRWITTRVPDLNKMITGLFKGDMCIIAAPPSMGKTSLALDICLYNSVRDKRALVFSLDQTEEAVVCRLLTSLTGISKSKMLRGNLTADEERKITIAAGQLGTNENLYITDRADITAFDIRSVARKIKRQHGLDIILIDYVQQIVGHKRAENRNLELAEISRLLKATAKELDVAMIVVSQLNRTYDRLEIQPEKGEWGFPKMSMLRDSGALEQDANTMIFPWVPLEILKKRYGENAKRVRDLLRDNPQLLSLAYLVVAKNKDGETGAVECCRDTVRMRFYSPSNRSDPEV